MSWKSVRKCEISRKSVPENGLEIEDRKSRKSKVAKYSKILADLPSEQIFTEITRWVPLLRCNCNYEVEQRRRTVSVLTRQTKRRKQSESLTLDDHRRTISMSLSENPMPILPNRAGNDDDRFRALSFSSLGQNTILEMKDVDEWDTPTRRDSEIRRVCFENELFDAVGSDDQKLATDLQSGIQSVNQEAGELSHAPSSQPRSDVFSSPVNENTHSNAGFEE